MKNLILLSFTLIAFASCSTKQKKVAVEKKSETKTLNLTGTKQVVICFYDNDGNDYVVFNSSNKTEVKPFLNLLSFEKTPQYKCGYTGSITYYKNEISDELFQTNSDELENLIKDAISIDFNLSEDCNHGVYIDNNNKLQSFKLTEEARVFLLKFMEKG